jgi:ribonuclease G
VKREIIINHGPLQTRAALLEDGTLVEFFLEPAGRSSLAGNIYKGKVVRVLPGMQAAFVAIGLEKSGFLHASDFLNEVESFGVAAETVAEDDIETEPLVEETPVGEAEDEAASSSAALVANSPSKESGRRRWRVLRRYRRPIEQKLKRNQEIIVQIAKEPIGDKGARLTSFVSLPGRHLVYLPTSRHIAISRRIEDPAERARLRAAVRAVKPLQGGFIIRTACEGLSKREIQRDISFLTKLWSSVVKKAETDSPPSLLYAEPGLPIRVVRDFFGTDVERLWCDDREIFEQIVAFVQQYMPRMRSRVAFYDSPEPIFDHFQIEPQIERALDRKVWLKSGGYLVFDQAEALTAVDVNTGRFVGAHDQDETMLKTNLEAAEELVNQLRVRNIGGIIVADFIDMAKASDRKKLTEALTQALKRDKARTSMLEMSDLGLIQMTRKRTRESLEQLVTENCPRCLGRRVVKSTPTLAAEALRAAQREVARRGGGVDMLVMRLNPEVARYLYGPGAAALEETERRLSLKIVLKSTEDLALGTVEFVAAPAAA